MKESLNKQERKGRYNVKMLQEKVFLHNLGKEICMARKRLNMSQIELAEKADLSLTYISRIECGHKNISAYTLARIADALKIPSSEIVTNAYKDKTAIIREAAEEALSELSPPKQRDVVEILRILSRLTTR